MAEPSDAFLKALDDGVQACGRLVRLGARKQEALAAWDLAAIEDILVAEREALAGLAVAESAQARAAAVLAPDPGLPANPGYVAIAEGLAGTRRARARALLEQLTELTTQLAAVSECNSQLIRRAQSYIEFRLAQSGRALAGSHGAPAYNDRGAAAAAAAGMPAPAGRHY